MCTVENLILDYVVSFNLPLIYYGNGLRCKQFCLKISKHNRKLIFIFNKIKKIIIGLKI